MMLLIYTQSYAVKIFLQLKIQKLWKYGISLRRPVLWSANQMDSESSSLKNVAGNQGEFNRCDAQGNDLNRFQGKQVQQY